MDERLEELKARLFDTEARLRRTEERLERYGDLINRPNAPVPMLKSSEKAFIRRAGGLSSLPLPDGENLTAFRESALKLVGAVTGLEIPADLKRRAEVISKTLRNKKELSVRSLLYITTQLIIILTSCVDQMSGAEQEAIVNELGTMIEVESLVLP